MADSITMDRNTRFLEREFGRALIPVMVSVLGGTVNTLIDSVFVTRRLNADALASVSLNMPVFLVLCMVGSLFGSGAFVASSRAFGENDKEAAVRYYHSALACSLLAGALFLLVGLFFSGNVARLLCGDPVLMPMVTDYCRITLIGAFSYILIYVPNYFLQLQGDAKSMTVMMGLMIATDVLFDYMFLYLLDWGIAGASLASVLSIFIACTYGFVRLQGEDGIFRVRWSLLAPYGMKTILSFGGVQAVGSLMDALKMIVLNWMIYRSGGSSSLAVWAVLNALLEISLCVLAGVPRTAEPLLGIYASGYDNEGIRMLVRLEFKVGLSITAAYSIAAIVLYRPIGAFFKLDASMLAPLACMGISLCFEMGCAILGSYYNVAKRVIFSNVVMILRSFVFLILFSVLLTKLNGMIWLFLPLSMAATLGMTVLISSILSWRTRGKPHEYSRFLLLDDYLVKNNQLMSISFDSSDEKICQASEYVTDFFQEHNLDRKKAMKLGLALEEVMAIMARKSLKNQDDPVDVRAYSYEDKIGLMIMCAGNKYDLFVESENEEDFAMGVQMIKRLSRECKYLYILGINVLSVEI